jgi:hypothetical protein
MNQNLLSSLLQALISNPQLLTDLVGAIENLFHHPSVQPNLPPVVPPPPPVTTQPPTPAQPGPTVFTPIVGKLQILGATNTETGQPASLPFHRNTHIHLDHNLGNPLPWPESLAAYSPSYTFTWDGKEGDVAPGSIDADGYAGRFNIMSLSDTLPHILRIALTLQVNGVATQGPWLTLPVQQA